MAIDVGGTAIKYTLTDKNAETIEINEIKTIRKPEKLFESLDEIIRPHLNQIAGIALSFPGKINAEHGIVNKVATFDWICDMPLKSIWKRNTKNPRGLKMTENVQHLLNFGKKPIGYKKWSGHGTWN